MSTLTKTTLLQVLDCGNCGIAHAIPDWLYEKAKNGREWYCPNGHKLHFLELESDRLRRELAAQAKRMESLESNVRWYQEARDDAERRCSAQKGQVTRLKKRISAGVCPCCHRQFQNLHSHMQVKHPDYAEKE